MPLTITLATTGRRSGRPRAATLYAFPAGEDGALVVIGSCGGRPRDPFWVVNLRANPAAIVRQGGEQRAVIAREVEGEERERWWRLAVEAFPLYAAYQRRTERRMPVFVLEPAAAPSV